MKNNQAGGIVSFVVIGLILVGLLAGGLYFSKSQGRVARENDTTTSQVATEQKAEETTKPEAKEETPRATEQQGQTAPTGSTTQPAQNNTSRPSANPQAPSDTNRVATTGPSDTLPATGPGETFATIMALAILSFTTFKFVRSRRDLLHSALRR